MRLRPSHAMVAWLQCCLGFALQAAKSPVELPRCSSMKQVESAVYDPSNPSPGCCGNQGCAGGVCGREVLPPLNAEVALLFLLGVSPKTPRKLFRRPSTLLLCTAGTSVMTIMITIITSNPRFQPTGIMCACAKLSTDECSASKYHVFLCVTTI